MPIHDHDGVIYHSYSSLDVYPELVHGITTRHGGASKGPYASLNLSHWVGDDRDDVSENLERAHRALGLRRSMTVQANQCHSTSVHLATSADCGQAVPNCDILMTNEPDVPMMLRYADCTPVLLFDPDHHAVAVVHSGWRGTVQGAARVAVESMAEHFGTRPAQLVAVIGPSIGPCCYEVGDEVVDAVRAAFSDPEQLIPKGYAGRHHFDLWAANEHWLAEAGVTQIEQAQTCTACHHSDFFSHRADHGKTGHFAAFVALRQGMQQ
jgi:polyphenol oxidase